jgi:GAF domain-containing protein
MSGAGIMLMSPDSFQGSVCNTDNVCDLIEQLQFTLGEGPSVDAYHEQSPVLEPDLAFPTMPRWFALSGPMLDAGVKAVFGFPIRVGAVRLGALNLYRDRPGSLTDDQHADSLMMADIAARAVLVMQSNAPAGELAIELENGVAFQYVVHQATGMVAAQLGASVGHALVRLRAHAYAQDQPLVEVARGVVARRIRFEP